MQDNYTRALADLRDTPAPAATSFEQLRQPPPQQQQTPMVLNWAALAQQVAMQPRPVQNPVDVLNWNIQLLQQQRADIDRRIEELQRQLLVVSTTQQPKN